MSWIICFILKMDANWVVIRIMTMNVIKNKKVKISSCNNSILILTAI